MHKLDRPYQQETYDKILSSKAKWVIVEAPTGSGKTAWAAQAAEDGLKTLALVRTKSLQDANYAGSYEFDVLKGKGNYRCGDRTFAYADECDHKCFEGCPYKLAKEAFLASERGSLNYTKFLLDWRVVDEFAPDIIFCDEAHQLSDLTLDYAGISLRWTRRLQEYTDTILIPDSIPTEAARAMGRMWLEELKVSLKENEPPKPKRQGNTEERKRWKFWMELSLKVENVLGLMYQGEELWFVHSNDQRFLCKPLTARYHFQGLFSKARKVVLMSATIGQAGLFAQELGLTEYEHIRVPDVWPARMRPIEDLKAPRMSWQSDGEERAKHAQVIADRINSCPDHWTGIVHVTSKAKARELGDRLDFLTGRPIWIPEVDLSTEDAMSDWLYFRHREGAIGVCWQFWEGADLKDDAFSIVAYAPYPDFSDPFEKARFNFDKPSALQRIANQLVQAWGRTRRGYPEHYGGMAEKLVAIADGKWSNLKGYISKSVLESIIY